MTDFSSHLIGRIDNATDLMGKRFGKLNQKTNDMIEDVGTYKLEEEEDGSYKNDRF